MQNEEKNMKQPD